MVTVWDCNTFFKQKIIGWKICQILGILEYIPFKSIYHVYINDFMWNEFFGIYFHGVNRDIALSFEDPG